MSSIEWTEETWNPVSGCTRASAGCDNCYAVTMTHRLEAMGQAKYAGLTVLNGKGKRHFNGVVRCHEDMLTKPLKRKKPTVYFVNSMSDLFHKEVPQDFIEKVLAVAFLTPQHTHQILTKRPERAAELYNYGEETFMHRVGHKVRDILEMTGEFESRRDEIYDRMGWLKRKDWWPLPNVWLGTSVEEQDEANERIPHLLRCPAAVRFLSCEPLLGPVDLNPYLRQPWVCEYCFRTDYSSNLPAGWDIVWQSAVCPHCISRGAIRNQNSLRGGQWAEDRTDPRPWSPSIHWVIVGGESGAGAKPCNVEWIRSIVDQCKAAGVPVFVKQLGSHPVMSGEFARGEFDPVNYPGGSKQIWKYPRKSTKGGDPSEWPEYLRVREYPERSSKQAESTKGGE